MTTFYAKLAAACALAATVGSASAASLTFGMAAPEFTGIEKWLNSDPLTMQQLKGKVVLVDFWTYTCINCVNTLPYVKAWHQKYQQQGLAVIGVHTPEFPHERSTDNVRMALKRFDIRYPVAQDNRYATWDAYSNRYWPAVYLFDKNGKLAYTHTGEGAYGETEAKIQQLLAAPAQP
ncbi:redoxin domain-containing protein [Duganella sp. FT92W]|uniref:Redoxin domain-containing protein n=1 Tax=Pseudoduganella rivuli TaxID=2666085 RepID=A0A7X2IUB9_9BURK|nr:thioredoxin family protein [Pseudoduganella rivuli]MRV76179.1 redoxin domain-containing protein [Pseudoduganella rivuli]